MRSGRLFLIVHCRILAIPRRLLGRDLAHASRTKDASLGVISRGRGNSSMAADNVWVLGLDARKVALRLPVPDAVAREDKVHLLERALVRLGVQRPDRDDAEHVDAAKDVQRLLVEPVEDGRQQQHAPAVADGPADDAPGVALGADLQREDLGRVQPGDGQPGRAEDGRVEEHEEGGRAADLGARVVGGGVEGGAREAAGGEHADSLADGAPVEGPAAADAVEGEDADEGGELGDVC